MDRAAFGTHKAPLAARSLEILQTAAFHAKQRACVAIALATLGVDLLCGLAAFFLERHGAQTAIKTLGSALFWTTTQLLTVSSSIKNPVSFGGRVLDVFMEAYAIIVIGVSRGGVRFIHAKTRPRDRREGLTHRVLGAPRRRIVRAP